MDKYRRVEQPKPQQDESISKNEIRITTQGKMKNFISYATNLFGEQEQEEVVLKAMGRAINKTVTIAEILKRRIENLHQITKIDSTDITDIWEPLEEGLDRIESTRHVSSITITLSTKPLDSNDPGYQPPLSKDQVVKPSDVPVNNRGRGIRRGRGRGRGFRGRGRGRGRGFRGNRGGFGDALAPVAVPPMQQEPTAQPDGMEGEVGEKRGRGGFRGRSRRGRFRGGYRGGRGRGGANAAPPATQE